MRHHLAALLAGAALCSNAQVGGGGGFTENTSWVTDLNGTALPTVRFAGAAGNWQAYAMDASRIALVYEEIDDDPLTNDVFHRLDIAAVGPLAQATNPTGVDQLPYLTNRYSEACGTGCVGLRSYGTVRYPGMFTGVDVSIASAADGLNISFLLQAGTDPEQVQLEFLGATTVTSGLGGNLTVGLGGHTLVIHQNLAYQPDGNGIMQSLGWQAGFNVNGNTAAPIAGTYDPLLPLLLAPVQSQGMPGGGGGNGLCWGTTFGGNGPDVINQGATDGAGALLITGTTNSVNAIPTQIGTTTAAYGGGAQRAYAAGFGADRSLQWLTYIGGLTSTGGTPSTKGFAIVTSGFQVFMGGETNWTSFSIIAGQPPAPAYVDVAGSNLQKGFITRLEPATGACTWATFFGDGVNSVQGLAIDAQLRLVACGSTGNTLPQPAAQLPGASVMPYGGGFDAFIAMFDQQLDLVWSTYFGGSGADNGIEVKAIANKIVLAGNAASPVLPVFNLGGGAAYSQAIAGGSDLFVAEFSVNGLGIWSTYLGGIAQDRLGDNGLDVNPITGDVYLAGYTLPVQGGPVTFPRVGSGYTDPIGSTSEVGTIARFSGVNRSLLWATQISGSPMPPIGNGGSLHAPVRANAFTSTLVGGCILGGRTYYPGHPMSAPPGWYLQNAIAPDVTTNNWFGDGLLMEFNSMNNINWSTYFGGQESTEAASIMDVVLTDGTVENTTILGIHSKATATAPFPYANPGAPAYYDDTFGNPGSVSITVNNDGFIAQFCQPPVDPLPPLTVEKTVSTAQTYAGSPVAYTITVCNNTSSTITGVAITDAIVFGNPQYFQLWPGYTNPLAGSGVTIDLAPGCVTYTYVGYFTNLGTYMNEVHVDGPGNDDPWDNAIVEILEGCPLVVAGAGDCTEGSVTLCLGYHSVVPDVGAVQYYWIYPSFLNPPSDLSGLSSTYPINTATSSIGTPISAPSWLSQGFPYGLSMVPVYIEFLNPVQFYGYGVVACLPFTYNSAPPAGMNVFYTGTIGNAGLLNFTTVFDGQGTEVDYPGFLTQAANITLTNCPGLEGPNPQFTLQQEACTGIVTVEADFQDPAAIHIWTWGDERTTPINGAQSYTYDYLAAITENTGWPLPQPIPPAAPGTYTITHTVVLNGVANTSTQQVDIYPCCEANTIIPAGSTASIEGSFFTGPVSIQGDFYLDQDVTIVNAQVSVAPGAHVVMEPGRYLRIVNSSFAACNGVFWKGITADDGCIVVMDNSSIADAEHALMARNSAILSVSSSEINNNRVGICVPEQGQFNSVSIAVSNTEFHAEGPLAQPYANQQSVLGAQGYAALDINDMYLDFSGGGNTIRDLSNGIVANQCDAYVTDCHFADIQPDPAYDELDGNGAAINAYGGKGWYTLKQVGPGMIAAPNFERCRWGVYTAYMNVVSSDNNMQDMGTAYRVMRSGYRGVDITSNTMRTRFHGMDLLANDGADHILVQNNSITFGDDPCTNNCPGYTGINVAEGNYENPSSVIRNNSIHYLPLSSSRTGINLLAADKWLVADNQLNMVHNIFNQYGVQLDGCNKTEVSCNTITSTDHNLINDRQAAIRNFMGSSPLISCNDMNWTTNGLLFNGVASNTDVRGNRMRKHIYGLHLGPTAIIDAQLLKGNLWYNAPVGTNGWGALNQHVDATSYPFTYNTAIISGGNTQPPSWSPLLWFQPTTSGGNYECEPDGEANYCSQFYAERCEGCLTELDERVRSGEIENNPYTPESRWILKSDLYTKLNDHPELLDGAPDLQTFYNIVANSTIADLKAVNDAQIDLYDLATSVKDQLSLNRDQAEAASVLLNEAIAQLSDPALGIAQRVALLSSINAFRETLAELAAYHRTALALASETKVLTAEAVKQANAAIGTSALIEANEKAVTEIRMATIGKDVDGFTADQTQSLYEIANQCPLSGGNAVFKARALYQLIDANAVYDDATLCLHDGYVIKSRTIEAIASALVVPNPAVDEATLLFSEEQKEVMTFVVFDALGAEVMSLTVPAGAVRFAFSTSGLAPALYHYQVRGPSGNLCSGKLTIVR